MSNVETCSWGTCTHPSYSKGLCKTHYQRQWRGSDMDAPMRGKRTPIANAGTTCAHPSCDRPRGNGGTLAYCSAHYSRSRLGLDMDAPIQDKRRGTIHERVARRLPADFTDECWEWPGGRNENDYGVLRRGGKDEPQIRVTNIVHELFIGPIPDEHRLVRHTCDNPPCVNPRHLVSGTDADNMRDKMLRGRGATKLTPDDVRAIRADPRFQREIAADYGITRAMVGYIKNRQQWAWVED